MLLCHNVKKDSAMTQGLDSIGRGEYIGKGDSIRLNEGGVELHGTFF